ncbi:HupE/UreJ family protein [Luteolibacter sp. GHJ8]|uniref:HupE/UreJ family protein n=1 Tax=Luteolibacter rhizosphaerae TaxID=2989719 RepID=A0ABT3G2J3_9BACT|nr:HupE/UreJ family protein [Luteolibacter rhizosphaerae]MCW1914040.1 HupE/UreJ family protein [Luteolibacter rhizosphaerae]
MLRFLLLLLCPLVLHAHQIAEIAITLEIEGDTAVCTAEVDAAYMLPEFQGDEDEEPKDLVWLRQQGPEGWAKISEATRTFWKDCLKLEADGKELDWSLDIPELKEASPPFMTEGEPEELPMIEAVIRATLPEGVHKLDAAWKEPFGVVLVVTVRKDAEAEVKPIVSGERMTLAERGDTDLAPVPRSIGDWIILGFHHILPLGVDHILFVLGLFLLAPKWRPLLQQTIIFTIAHSITLGMASLGWVDTSSDQASRWVEILIAASIAWVGIENLLVKELGKGRLALVGLFGLIHGLGFASVLSEWLPKDHPEQLAGALFGFNVGVEVGQITVLLGAFALFGWWKDRFVWVKWTGSVLVGLAGLILVIERLMEVEILTFL